ncbi:hypothetical protein [Agrobacterium tumefaciens]|uniref:hypothetical protein n=1 Tax=Agrobacterium tumefaciens TaxID=358 RepID=UPI0015721367|nr:hypothetical protein [Agrobacterium tumefaciens]NTE37651.1 hypothetical protein [Agrobacterium tumefaciens]NTE53163.1 hypothetical protein [Agrobacterium tumefaciens]
MNDFERQVFQFNDHERKRASVMPGVFLIVGLFAIAGLYHSAVEWIYSKPWLAWLADNIVSFFS